MASVACVHYYVCHPSNMSCRPNTNSYSFRTTYTVTRTSLELIAYPNQLYSEHLTTAECIPAPFLGFPMHNHHTADTQNITQKVSL